MMIKKLFHYVCFAVAAVLWGALLGIIFQQAVLLVYNINLLNPQAYKVLSDFWNKGGALHSKEILMLSCAFLCVPIFIYGCYKLYHYKFMRLITVPLNRIVNSGLDDYKAPNVNIKNLKVEEKKTLDQIIQERLEKENKKNQAKNAGNTDFRKKIIEQIEENKK